MMVQRKKWFFGAICALLVLNVWQWWPVTQATSFTSERLTAGKIHADKLQLKGYASDQASFRKVGRDLFFIADQSAPIPEPVSNRQDEQVKSSIVVPKKSATVVKKSRPISDVSHFKLVGVLFKNGERHAYLVKGDSDYSVRKGEKIEGRYLVKEVTVTTVTLMESGTRKSTIVYMQ